MKRIRGLSLVVAVLALVASVPARAGVEEDITTAVDLYKQGKVAEALVILDRLEPKHPKLAKIKYYKALCYTRQGKLEQAVNKANAAITLNPSMMNAYVAKADAQIRLKRYDAALATVQAFVAWKKSKADNPEAVKIPAAVLFMKGVALAYKGDSPGVIETMEKVLADEPKRAYAHYYLGYAYYNTGQKAKAIPAFERFLELAPNAPEAAQIRELLRRLQG